ncbi:MAG: hypothetical protein OXC81_02875 [Betaproteobacteria bacterium]|nr:hypothetical protein [Betaproteobacteria bacterium]
MVALIIIGDIIVSGMIIGVAIWLFTSASDEKLAQAARIPLDEDQEQC